MVSVTRSCIKSPENRRVATVDHNLSLDLALGCGCRRVGQFRGSNLLLCDLTDLLIDFHLHRIGVGADEGVMVSLMVASRKSILFWVTPLAVV